MAAKCIIPAVIGSFGVAWICDTPVSESKIFGGTTPKTVSSKEWFEETDKKFQAWPRTAGSPVVMNPIARQNFVSLLTAICGSAAIFGFWRTKTKVYLG